MELWITDNGSTFLVNGHRVKHYFVNDVERRIKINDE